jgi:hypothetical protein
LIEGHLYQKKYAFLKERFTTLEGLADFFIGTAIWSYLILKYYTQYYDWIHSFFTFSWGWVNTYVAHLITGLSLSILGLLLSFIIIKFYHVVKSWIGG